MNGILSSVKALDGRPFRVLSCSELLLHMSVHHPGIGQLAEIDQAKMKNNPREGPSVGWKLAQNSVKNTKLQQNQVSEGPNVNLAVHQPTSPADAQL